MAGQRTYQSPAGLLLVSYMARVRHPGRILRRVTLACGLAGLLAGAAAAPAHATDVAVEGATLHIVDRAGEANTLALRQTEFGYEVFDEVSALTPGAGCVAVAPSTVICQAMIVKIVVDAGGGDDFVMLGNVTVAVEASGGTGDDLVEGGQVTDLLGGGSGDDSVFGGGGNDGLAGEAGADLLQGGSGGDAMSGGDGADVLEDDGAGGDRLNGNGGRDLLKGGRGDDTLDGGSGADVLVTGTGRDTAKPGSGDDRVFAGSGDSIDCKAEGADKVHSSGAPPPGCSNLADSAEEPDIWPPPSQSYASSTAATTVGLVARAARNAPPLPSGPHAAQVLRRGEARRIGLQIHYGFRMRVGVRVRTYRRSESLIREFYERVDTRQPTAIPIQGPAGEVWSAQVQCCFNGRG